MKKKDKIENSLKIYPVPKEDAERGKKPFQKLKPYLVLQYLLKETDEAHVADSATIIKYLNDIGIYAERRSIYKDVEAINQVVKLTGVDLKFMFEERIDEDCKKNNPEMEAIKEQLDATKEAQYAVRKKKIAMLAEQYKNDPVRIALLNKVAKDLSILENKA
jgi:hypothetical protein